MTSADSLFSQAMKHHTIGDLDAAKILYHAALRSDPKHLPSLMNLGDILSRRNQISAAAAIASRAIGLAPTNASLWGNYGNFLKRLERYDSARVALEKSKALAPDNIGTLHNLLLLELREGNYAGALDCYSQIVILGADSPAVQNDLAHIHLASGDLEGAFEAYESRWHIMSHQEAWDLRVPEWQGEPLSGKRILVHHEQGHGDTIMTSRFVPTLVAFGAKVTFAVEGVLVPLFEAQNWNIEVIDIHTLDENDTHRFDFHSPLYSIMKWLRIDRTDIRSNPFLSPPQIVVPPVFSNMFNVGICWASGRRGNYMDWRRRISPLELWLPLSELPNVQLWSLTPGSEAQNEIINLGAEAIVIDEVTKFSDFAETAAFIDRLDLVISVDTAVAHLSAGMGKPTWMLSQFTPCWRWWDLANGTGKPWYDIMEILAQPSPGDWKSQLEECRKSLQLLSMQLPEKRSAA